MSDAILNFHRRRSYGHIVKDKVIRLQYAVSDADTGNYIEFRDDLLYLHGGYGGAPEKIEAELEGLSVGMSRELVLAPGDAYGERNPDLIVNVPLDDLPREARDHGAGVEAEGPDGATIEFRVTAINDGVATLDGNHPLAGRRLRFVLEVLDIRAATSRELELGYALRIDDSALPENGNVE